MHEMDAPQLPVPGVSGFADQQHQHQQQNQYQYQQQQQQTQPMSFEQPPTVAPAEDPIPSTASTVHPAHNNGYSSDSRAHYSSRASHDFTAQEGEPSRFNFSPSLSTYQPQLQPSSRPSSGLSSGPERHGYAQQSQEVAQKPPSQVSKNSVVIKVGMVGDAQIGKTSLMVKYVEGSWDEDYIQTLGVNFMEKTISIRNTEITFSIWDLGGQREFVNMLPLVCNDAVAILFMFDLTRKSTLNSIKEWYRQGRGFNKTAIPFLVGTKYDHFVNFPREDQEEISIQAFDLKCTIPEVENIGEPLLLYKNV